MEKPDREKSDTLENIDNLINEIIYDFKESENDVYILTIKIVELVEFIDDCIFFQPNLQINGWSLACIISGGFIKPRHSFDSYEP